MNLKDTNNMVLSLLEHQVDLIDQQVKRIGGSLKSIDSLRKLYIMGIRTRDCVELLKEIKAYNIHNEKGEKAAKVLKLIENS